MKNPTGKRLSKEEWNEIKDLMESPDRNLSAIARQYGVNRSTIYSYSYRKGWLEREEAPKLNFWQRIWTPLTCVWKK